MSEEFRDKHLVGLHVDGDNYYWVSSKWMARLVDFQAAVINMRDFVDEGAPIHIKETYNEMVEILQGMIGEVNGWSVFFKEEMEDWLKANTKNRIYGDSKDDSYIVGQHVIDVDSIPLLDVKPKENGRDQDDDKN